MSFRKSFASFVSVFMVVGMAHAVPDAENGKRLAAGSDGGSACVGCHGADGGGNAQDAIPRLAGLNEAYLVKQLTDFRSGTRRNAQMSAAVATLSGEDIMDLARYYAGLEAPAQSIELDIELDKDGLAHGKQIATEGDWDRGIPACFRCHGTDGGGVAPHMPPLAGQHASYLVKQLVTWQHGERRNDPLDLMSAIAKRLDQKDIHAVANYLASLPVNR